MPTQDTIPFHMPREAALLIQEILAIGLKAHNFNPSPVEIKEQLAAMPKERLQQLHYEISNVL